MPIDLLLSQQLLKMSVIVNVSTFETFGKTFYSLVSGAVAYPGLIAGGAIW